MRLGGREHKHNMGGRLLERFQKRVKGGNAEHVNFVNDIYLIKAVRRHVFDIFPQLPDLIDAVIGCAIDFKNVYCIPGGDFFT